MPGLKILSMASCSCRLACAALLVPPRILNINHSDVWEKGFPVIVKNLLEAATVTGAVLVWVDNLYMFGPEAAESGLPMKVREPHERAIPSIVLT